ncbi:MAG: ParB/RepB/Spo0J family partition protein [Candidatus Omnitrophota bacterium]|jgi:ParB family chromosome partitioning protein|nr:ParB/RepB/Spo0J family partition protein [Candidatus Omnitrophota bacterium]
MDKRVLGRGLKALIPDKKPVDKTHVFDSKIQQGITTLPIDKIRTNQYQPRGTFDQDSLNELAASIKAKGFIQPIIVRAKEGAYELIAGERRLRAAKKLNLQEVPAIIKDVSDVDSLELAIIENVQRQDLNPIDQAKAYNRLLGEFDMTHEEIASSIGKDRATVSNIMRLLKLPQKIQEYVSRGTLSMGHARAILSLDKETTQHRLCTKVVKNALSVRDTERYAKQMLEAVSRKGKPRATTQKDPDLIALEEKLQDILGTKVRILQQKRGGKIEIEFYSDTDLERVVTLLKSNR